MTFNKLALAATLFGSVMAGSASAQAGSATDSDVVLINEVQQAINARPALAADRIHVSAVDGVVYLYGVVDTPLESATAEQITESVHGVQKVVNAMAANRGDN